MGIGLHEIASAAKRSQIAGSHNLKPAFSTNPVRYHACRAVKSTMTNQVSTSETCFIRRRFHYTIKSADLVESNQIGADGEGTKQTLMLSQATIKMTFPLPATPIFAKTMFTRSSPHDQIISTVCALLITKNPLGFNTKTLLEVHPPHQGGAMRPTNPLLPDAVVLRCVNSIKTDMAAIDVGVVKRGERGVDRCCSLIPLIKMLLLLLPFKSPPLLIPIRSKGPTFGPRHCCRLGNQRRQYPE